MSRNNCGEARGSGCSAITVGGEGFCMSRNNRGEGASSVCHALTVGWLGDIDITPHRGDGMASMCHAFSAVTVEVLFITTLVEGGNVSS